MPDPMEPSLEFILGQLLGFFNPNGNSVGNDIRSSFNLTDLIPDDLPFDPSALPSRIDDDGNVIFEHNYLVLSLYYLLELY